jgi:hypothetical protein
LKIDNVELHQLQKKILSEESLLQQTLIRRHNTLKKCEIEQILLPKKAGPKKKRKAEEQEEEGEEGEEEEEKGEDEGKEEEDEEEGIEKGTSSKKFDIDDKQMDKIDFDPIQKLLDKKKETR